MADNIELNSGSGGATLATDDAGAGGHVQIVKLAISTDGSATLIPAEASNGLDVDVTRIQAGDTVIGRVKLTDGTDVVLVTAAGELNVLDSNSAAILTAVDGVEALLTTIDADTGTLAGAVAGTEMQVDVVASLPAGTNAIGKLAANSGVDIGDVDVTSIAAGTNVIGATLEVSGLAIENATQLTVNRAIIDAATSGNNTLVAAVTNKKIRVLSAFLVSSGTVNVRFESGADGTALTGQMNLIANTGFVLPHNPHGWFQTADSTLLNLELSAAVSVDGCLTYIEAE